MISVQKYSKMVDVQSEFEERVNRIPIHGLGLSVDVYTPDLFDLAEVLSGRGVEVDYFEIFQASLAALRSVKLRLPDRRLAYHGEGLWVTQPEFCDEQRHRNAIAEVSAQLHALNSAWLNIECATKQMSGYSFGTYLPPLYTELGARMAAENLRQGQQLIDQDFQARDVPPPLLLVEMPPLTYFAYGAHSIPDFYERITREAACGLVLDIGHLWTVYRYTAAWRRRSLDQFTEQFLAAFPLERVVEIHVAGLGNHTAQIGAPADDRSGIPRWIDAHGESIPAVLFDMLQQVLE
ncbi:MAG: multinuclear nonheme iron-dependent oxidase, partial [Nitrospiraceae bacterium]